MLFLILDISDNLLYMRLTHGESAVATLPGKLPLRVGDSLDPRRRSPFDLLYHPRQRMVFRQSEQGVDVLFDSTNDPGFAVMRSEDSSQISMHVEPQGS